ncbi:MAG: YiiD C-terminal domain-containing protein [Planctomycetaceae bacterium]
MTSREELEDYIHRQIPITLAMGVRIQQADVDRVVLTAPLAPNINHRETVFGGSAAAIATLAAWTLILVRLRSVPLRARLVIAENSMRYTRPITGDFSATAEVQDPDEWHAFLSGLQRKEKPGCSRRQSCGWTTPASQNSAADSSPSHSITSDPASSRHPLRSLRPPFR